MQTEMKVMGITLAFLALLGCTTNRDMEKHQSDLRQADMVQKYLDDQVTTERRSQARVKAIREWRDKPKVGMTRQEAINAMGQPIRSNVTEGAFGRHEQWIYETYGTSYFYFDDGKLTSWQFSE